MPRAPPEKLVGDAPGTPTSETLTSALVPVPLASTIPVCGPIPATDVTLENQNHRPEQAACLQPDHRGLPSVLETKGTPTAAGVAGACCNPTGKCCFVILAVFVFTMVASMANNGYWIWRTCESESGAELDCVEVEPASPVRIAAAKCNSCNTHYDGQCDEPSNPALNGDSGSGTCPAGTDGFDCAVAYAQSEAKTANAIAQSQIVWAYFPSIKWTLVIVSIVCVCVTCALLGPVVCCCGWARKRRLKEFPVWSDQLFELVHVPSLGIIQLQSLFLVIFAMANPFFDLQTCEQTFAVSPYWVVPLYPVDEWRYTTSDYETHVHRSIWPSSSQLPDKQIVFRSQYTIVATMLILLSITRFLLLGAANSRWDNGVSTSKISLALASFLSLWSAGFFYQDSQYCVLPAFWGGPDQSASDYSGQCTLYSSRLPSEGVSSLAFKTDCGIQRKFDWFSANVSYYQPLDVNEDPQLLDSYTSAFQASFYQAAKDLSDFRTPGFQPFEGGPPRTLESLQWSTKQSEVGEQDTIMGWSASCLPRKGTALEGLAQYLDDCENNSRSISLLIYGLLAMNVGELVYLWQILLVHLRPESWMLRMPTCFSRCRCSRWQDVNNSVRMPGRLHATLIITWLLTWQMIQQLSDVATEIENSISDVDALYSIVRNMNGQNASIPGIGILAVDNPYFSSASSAMPPLSKVPIFHDLSSDCPCGTETLFTRDYTLFSELYGAYSRLVQAATSRQQVYQTFVTEHPTMACPPHSRPGFDPRTNSTICLCYPGFLPDARTFQCLCETRASCVQVMEDILQREDTGVLLKCTAEWVRRIYEPLPFCIRAATAISVGIGLVSTMLAVKNIQQRLRRIKCLVDTHYCPNTGYTSCLATLSAPDRQILAQDADANANISYQNLTRVPFFIGLYAGNFVAAFVMFWVFWLFALYVLFSQAMPVIIGPLMISMIPVLVEYVLKVALNSSMVDPVRGMMHPRLYSVVDLGFSILSAFTGPIKTIMRLLLGFACLALHLFRVDVSLMLDKRFVNFDLHYRATLGLYQSFRLRCEFEKDVRLRDTVGTRAFDAEGADLAQDSCLETPLRNIESTSNANNANYANNAGLVAEGSLEALSHEAADSTPLTLPSDANQQGSALNESVATQKPSHQPNPDGRSASF